MTALENFENMNVSAKLKFEILHRNMDENESDAR